MSYELIQQDILNLHIKIDSLTSKIDILNEKIEQLCICNKEGTEKLNSHITFIESVYATLKNPLDIIKRRITSYNKYLSE